MNILQRSFVHLAAEHDQVPNDLIFIYVGVPYATQQVQMDHKEGTDYTTCSSESL